MKSVRLFLPGQFEDAYLYRGRLIVLTANQTIRAYELDHIVAFIEDRVPSSRPWPKLLFTRNDWLSSEQFLEILSNPEVFHTLLGLLDNLPQPFVLNDGEVQFSEYELAIQADVVLDMNIYNGRLYLGANTGLYCVDLDWDRSTVQVRGEPQKKFDARCLSTSARYGAVNASCGDDGLHTFFDEFGWVEDRAGAPSHRTKQIAQRSYRTAWLDYDLVNYVTYTDLQLLKGSRARIDSLRGLERESTILTDMETSDNDLGVAWERLRREHGVERGDVQYSFNSNKALFVSAFGGQLYSVGIERTQTGQVDVSYAKSNEGLHEQILSATPTKLGLVVETENRVSLFARNQWQDIVDAEALVVRVFTQSHRYQHAVAVTTEGGLWIVGMFEDHRTESIKRRNRRNVSG